MQRVDESRIIAFYRGQTPRSLPQLTRPLAGLTLTTSAHGIGDIVVLGALARSAIDLGSDVSIHVPGVTFSTIRRFWPVDLLPAKAFWAAADRLVFCFDLGNGHYTQRLQRAFGYFPDTKPRGLISINEPTLAGRVVVHIEPGQHQEFQRRNIHPRAREVYPQHIEVIDRFAHEHPELEFVEIGNKCHAFKHVRPLTGLDLGESIKVIATAEYFMGIMSGPLHIAAALDKKIIAIVNFPPASAIVLPTLRDINQVESEWFYPQSVILHQDDDSLMVPRFSAQTLAQAFAGEIYPYWSDRYLHLTSDFS